MNRVIQSALVRTVCCLIVLATVSQVAGETPDVEQGVMDRLDRIRAITVTSDQELLSQYNDELDEAWTFFKDNREAALPILVRELTAEREKEDPDDYLLLDVGYFLCLESNEDPLYKEEARKALYSLNPDDEVVAANYQQFFHFVHAVAADKDPRVLELIDRAFLRKPDITVFVAQHSLTLDATLTCVFLYGIYGQGAEEHLITLLDDPGVLNRVIEVLIWIGSDRGIDAVNKAMTTHRNYDTFVRGFTFMMETGGPVGRDILLEIDMAGFDSASQQYYSNVRDAVASITYEAIRGGFAEGGADAKLPDDEIKKRLANMYETYGKDDETNPAAVFLSDLPKEFLIGELRKIRSRIFYRVSDEALSDVQITNLLINALQYRPR